MKKVIVEIFGNTHMTTCLRQKNLQLATKKKGILEIWLYQSIELEKGVKITKRSNVKNTLFGRYCI